MIILSKVPIYNESNCGERKKESEESAGRRIKCRRLNCSLEE